MGRRRGRKPKSSEEVSGGLVTKVTGDLVPPITITLDPRSGDNQFQIIPKPGSGPVKPELSPIKAEPTSQESLLKSTPDSDSEDILPSYQTNRTSTPISPILKSVTGSRGVQGRFLPSPVVKPQFETITEIPGFSTSPDLQVLNQKFHEPSPKNDGLTTPVKNSQELSAAGYPKLTDVKVEDPRINFSTPKRPIPPPTRISGGINSANSPDSETIFNSPIFVTVRLESPNEAAESDPDIDDADDEDASGRYKLRPRARRNLFPKALTLQRYQSPRNNTNTKVDITDDENDVLFVVDEADSDDDEDEEEDEGYGRRRATYGSRGPKADAKALSLISNCPMSVKWLVDNFEYHPGKSLPRGFVYDQYILLCTENGVDPLNAASFGKLIRSVFPGLKTRRLGTRGNSKYHYNGVFLRNESPLLHIMNLMRTQEGLLYDNSGKRGRRVRKAIEEGPVTGRPLPKVLGQEVGPEGYLGKRPEMGGFLTGLSFDRSDLPENFSRDDITTFENIYAQHSTALISAFSNFDLTEATSEWKRFWRIKLDEDKPSRRYNGIDYDEAMTKRTLMEICTLPPAARFVYLIDMSAYQFIIEILFPNMYKSMPVAMAHSLKNFMKTAQQTLMKILNGYPKLVTDVKLNCLRTMMQMWNDYSKLNRMVGSVEQTLHFEDSVQIMRTELGRALDLEVLTEDASNYQGEATWSLLAHLLINFQSNLEDHDQSIQGWVEWTAALVDKLAYGDHILFKKGWCLPNINRCWKFASDSMLGAIVKGNAATLGIFKILITWCDSLIAHMVMLETARSLGFTMPIFYFASRLKDPNEPKRRPALKTITYPEKGEAQATDNGDKPGPSRNITVDRPQQQPLSKPEDVQGQPAALVPSPDKENAQVVWDSEPVVPGSTIIMQQDVLIPDAQGSPSNNMNNFLLEIGVPNTVEVESSQTNHVDDYNANVMVLDPEMFSDSQLLGYFQDSSNFNYCESNTTGSGVQFKDP